MTTGMDLRLERTAARVKLGELAARMGRHPATLHRYEGLAVVPEQVTTDYRAALASLTKDATVEVAAA